MPWKECSVLDERLRFVAQLLDGEAMSEVCRAFGISRKTGYKIFERYKEHGLEALTDRSRRPVRPRPGDMAAGRTAMQFEESDTRGRSTIGWRRRFLSPSGDTAQPRSGRCDPVS